MNPIYNNLQKRSPFKPVTSREFLKFRYRSFEITIEFAVPKIAVIKAVESKNDKKTKRRKKKKKCVRIISSDVI
ncbi:hypothetical protein EUTSA_v10015192mg [Eutrema salsugineum]|uniref:Uncharacterized protein n=1 Tax=Eutrema salsugineum TaxID=72664 RepID=V4LIF7_EUTSA|nr:hypothetical protein EUTSA_v10015192mg [Eutrema salsugineum]